jgi:hypothetical protein
MTDPRNPSDPDSPREGESAAESWTWQRPDDGSPVYGDPSAGGELPPPQPPSEPAAYEPPPLPSQPPGIGPAQPGHHRPAQGAPSGPWDYQQQQGWQEAPPQQWAASQDPGAPPPPAGVPQGYGLPYGAGYPPPQPPRPPGGMNKGLFSLFTGIISLFLGICCCPPIGIIGGIVGAVLGWSGMKDDKAIGQSGATAALGFWLSIAAIVLSLVNLILSIIIQIYYPDMVTDMLRDLGLG